MLKNRVFPYVLSLLLLAISLYGSYRAVNGYSKAEVARMLQERLNLHMSNFQSLLETHDYLPEVLANHPAVSDYISHPQDGALRLNAGYYLNQFAQTAGVESVYLLDSKGNTLLSGNNAPPVPVLSYDNQIRPYFARAVAGLKTRRFWVDPRTNEPGIFFFSPIRDKSGEVAGVSVVNAKLDDFEANWRSANELVFITDLEGIIFISSQPQWRFSATENIDESNTAKELARYYNIKKVTNIDFIKESPYSQNINHVTFAGTPALQYMVKSSVIPKSEWILQVYQDTSFIKYRLIFAFIISGLISIVLLLTTLYLMQRRHHIHELEGRVKHRTAELSAAIKHLKNEIREKKKVETTLRDTQDGLIQTGKMAVLGQLATSITHELNQPLTALMTYAENTLILTEQGNNSPLITKNLSSMTQLAERMASITRMLKTFAYDSREKTSPVLVNLAIHNTLSIIRMKLRESDIVIEYKQHTTELIVMANLVRLEQVLLNIISNAIDAIDESAQKIITIKDTSAGENAIITIEDSGEGISDEKKHTIFEPFVTSKKQGLGLGLGLSISHQIIKSFNGELVASNAPTGGAIFTITIPLYHNKNESNNENTT